MCFLIVGRIVYYNINYDEFEKNEDVSEEYDETDYHDGYTEAYLEEDEGVRPAMWVLNKYIDFNEESQQ